MKPVYYDIDEAAASAANRMNSFSSYTKNEATEEYKQQVDYIYSLLEELPKEAKEKGEKLADKYARLYAKNTNKRNSIRASYPSMLIAGPAGINTARKEKQNSRFDAAIREWQYIDTIEEQIKNLKYYTPRVEHQGYARSEEALVNEFFEVVQNEEANRIQLIFEGKPDEETRSILKKHGLRWSPKFGAWQRQLTQNARWAVQSVIKELRKNSSSDTLDELPKVKKSKRKKKQYDEGEVTYTPYMRTRTGKTIYAKDYGKKVFKITD